MDEFALLKKHWLKFASGSAFFFILFIILLCSSSSGGSTESIIFSSLSVPFNEEVKYTITSKFGERTDPFDETKKVFHSGIDLSAPEGTNILASANGKVIEVGYSEDGLGNYVYLEHDLGGIMLYTIYGHMLDDSIVVKKDDMVQFKDKIGVIGSTGKSTGTHLHFTISINKLSFDKKNLVDPLVIFEGI